MRREEDGTPRRLVVVQGRVADYEEPRVPYDEPASVLILKLNTID